LHQWQKNLRELKEKAVLNPNAYTISKGMSIQNKELEEKLTEWFEEMRAEDIAVSTQLIIMQACKLQKDFKGGQTSKMI
jgi:hypothetical protein